MSELKPCPYPDDLPGRLRWWATECDRTNGGCYVPSILLEAAAQLDRRAQPENAPLSLRFGTGDIGVSTCAPEDSAACNELLLWNPHMRQGIGEPIPVAEGTTTDDVDVFARLIFDNAASAQVVAKALNRIIDSLGGRPAITLDELRGMDGEPV